MSKSNVLRERLTRELVGLQETTLDQPYSISHRLKLAEAYKDLGYPDLAAGDAYKALILIDEVVQEGEYHDDALEAARSDMLSGRMEDLAIDSDKEASFLERDQIATWAEKLWSKSAYAILIGCLIDCGCFRSAFDYIYRARKAFPDSLVFRNYDEELSDRLKSHFERNGVALEDVEVDEYPDKGLVRREQYPWNHHEPNRFSTECLDFLNEELRNIAPKLEVRVTELPVLTTTETENGSLSDTTYTKQLGLFAKDDIAPGEKVLEEKSLLTAISRLHDSYCDACSIPLSTFHVEKDTIISCEECDEVFFCSQKCHDLAQDHYHPSICGVSVDQGKVPASEAADSLYTLLLFRALALAETRNLHPLELKELRYIWGDYRGKDLETAWQADPSGRLKDPFGHVPQTLPFSFKNNVLMPLHVLEKMEVNVFTQSHRYDTWIFNTLYAKFRGTASAQQGLDGRPEISAVHPMWCLANHSCDPNVAWEWRGSMRFWTREKLVDWQGRDADKGPGLKKDEEVLGHYCDIRLPVKERREWAVGALGGECMCARCVWEEAAERKQDGLH
ncbi:Wd tetratricopeptide repeat domain-containing [Pyrenophora seminiperda CCB06]|uniref:Wd tetratricopeptide repeat domain-containing n=1 Tax=Pyrenophora seminiperda CCB06 TaxID=1302712 RepID=A0A3M7MCW5_9PLEO|nr:Wd tetratricopeptide repeat domain-containing [Pyrenophora seminiperda CCB06]